MSPQKSFLLFVKYGGVFLSVLVLFIGLLYYHDQKQEFKHDLANGYGVKIKGTIIGIEGKRADVVDVTYQYHGYTFTRDIDYFNIDSMIVGAKVNLIISGIHPGNDVLYIGVDTMASRHNNLPLIQPHHNF